MDATSPSNSDYVICEPWDGNLLAGLHVYARTHRLSLYQIYPLIDF